MIFSVDYRSQRKIEAQEIRCPYNHLGTLFPFIKEHPEKRINILLKDNLNDKELKKAIEQIEIVKEIVQDYTVQCFTLEQLLYFRDRDYKAYVKFPITDWEFFQNLREAEVSDIYIDGPLGFYADDIASIKGNIKIRVSPTLSPNVAFNKVRGFNSFFIRPEDILLYENMIDVIDFNVQNNEREDTLLDIYTRRNFVFAIKQLIPNLDTKVSNVMLKDSFAKHRLNCRQICKRPGSGCHFCESYFTFLDTTKDLLTK